MPAGKPAGAAAPAPAPAPAQAPPRPAPGPPAPQGASSASWWGELAELWGPEWAEWAAVGLCGAGVGAGLCAVAAAVLRGPPRRGAERLRAALARAHWPGGVVLRGARVPRELLLPAGTPAKGAGAVERADAEGLVECDIRIRGGLLAEVAAPGVIPRAWGSAEARLGGCVLLPCFADCRVHLGLAHSVGERRNPSGCANDAAELQRLADADAGSRAARKRADFALSCAYAYGSAAVRTYLDGLDTHGADHRDGLYQAFGALREKWKKRGLEVQGVASMPLGEYPDWGLAHAAEASRHGGVVLGAFCGGCSAGGADAAAMERSFDALFKVAAAHGHLDVDLSLDEGNNPESFGFASLCQSLARARARGYSGRVLVGGASSLSLQSASMRRTVVEAVREVGPITVVCLPFSSLSTHDRRGTAPPAGVVIPRDEPRTPLWRGLTLVQELKAAGVSVAAASDHVRDCWNSAGSDHDMLRVWGLTLALGQLDTAPSEGDWVSLATSAPAEAMGLRSSLHAGDPANLVIFPEARGCSELLGRAQGERLVLRRGRLQAAAGPPAFADLDRALAPAAAPPAGAPPASHPLRA